MSMYNNDVLLACKITLLYSQKATLISFLVGKNCLPGIGYGTVRIGIGLGDGRFRFYGMGRASVTRRTGHQKGTFHPMTFRDRSAHAWRKTDLHFWFLTFQI